MSCYASYILIYIIIRLNLNASLYKFIYTVIKPVYICIQNSLVHIYCRICHNNRITMYIPASYIKKPAYIIKRGNNMYIWHIDFHCTTHINKLIFNSLSWIHSIKIKCLAVWEFCSVIIYLFYRIKWIVTMCLVKFSHFLKFYSLSCLYTSSVKSYCHSLF